MLAVVLLVLVVLMSLVALLWCGISSRLGYPGPLGLLVLVPFAGIVLLIYWACAESPNEARLRRLTRRGRRSFAFEDEDEPVYVEGKGR
jgi:hypothetical protein